MCVLTRCSEQSSSFPPPFFRGRDSADRRDQAISCQRGRKQETFNAGSGTLYSERRLGFNSSFFFCDRMNMTVLFLNLEFLTCFLESARRFSSFFPFLFVFSWRRSVSASSSSVKFSSHWFKVQIGTRAQYRVLQEPVLLNPNADWNLLPESSQSYV